VASLFDLDNSDILAGWQMSVTMQLRTPLKWLTAAPRVSRRRGAARRSVAYGARLLGARPQDAALYRR
jgi:hypothetical protein